MLSHILWPLVLVLLAVETVRTVRRFGVHRGGMAANVLSRPSAHMFIVALYGALALFFYPRTWAPLYVTIGLLLLALFYLGAIVKWIYWDRGGGADGSEDREDARRERQRQARRSRLEAYESGEG